MAKTLLVEYTEMQLDADSLADRLVADGLAEPEWPKHPLPGTGANRFADVYGAAEHVLFDFTVGMEKLALLLVLDGNVFGGAVTEIVSFEDPAKALPDEVTRDDFLVRTWLGDTWLRTIIEASIIDVDDEKEDWSEDEFTETVDRFVAEPSRDSTIGRGTARVMLHGGLGYDAGRLTRASPVRLDLFDESVLLDASLELADEADVESLLQSRIDWWATGRPSGSNPHGPHLRIVSTMLDRRGAESSTQREMAS